MKYKNAIRTLLCCVIMLVLLAIDLVSKMFAHITNLHQATYFLGIVRIWVLMNPGAAFGLAGDNPKGMIAITALTVVLIIGIAVLFFTVFRKNFAVKVPLAVIEAGAVGNLIDRLYFHSVRDFIDVVRFLFIPQYTCNIADIFIVFGAIVLVFIILFIGPGAVFPLTKKWREESKRQDAEREKERAERREKREQKRVDKMLERAGYSGPDEGDGE